MTTRAEDRDAAIQILNSVIAQLERINTTLNRQLSYGNTTGVDSFMRQLAEAKTEYERASNTFDLTSEIDDRKNIDALHEQVQTLIKEAETILSTRLLEVEQARRKRNEALSAAETVSNTIDASTAPADSSEVSLSAQVVEQTAVHVGDQAEVSTESDLSAPTPESRQADETSQELQRIVAEIDRLNEVEGEAVSRIMEVQARHQAAYATSQKAYGILSILMGIKDGGEAHQQRLAEAQKNVDTWQETMKLLTEELERTTVEQNKVKAEAQLAHNRLNLEYAQLSLAQTKARLASLPADEDRTDLENQAEEFAFMIKQWQIQIQLDSLQYQICALHYESHIVARDNFNKAFSYINAFTQGSPEHQAATRRATRFDIEWTVAHYRYQLAAANYAVAESRLYLLPQAEYALEMAKQEAIEPDIKASVEALRQAKVEHENRILTQSSAERNLESNYCELDLFDANEAERQAQDDLAQHTKDTIDYDEAMIMVQKALATQSDCRQRLAIAKCKVQVAEAEIALAQAHLDFLDAEQDAILTENEAARLKPKDAETDAEEAPSDEYQLVLENAKTAAAQKENLAKLEEFAQLTLAKATFKLAKVADKNNLEKAEKALENVQMDVSALQDQHDDGDGDELAEAKKEALLAMLWVARQEAYLKISTIENKIAKLRINAFNLNREVLEKRAFESGSETQSEIDELIKQLGETNQLIDQLKIDLEQATTAAKAAVSKFDETLAAFDDSEKSTQDIAAIQTTETDHVAHTAPGSEARASSPASAESKDDATHTAAPKSDVSAVISTPTAAGAAAATTPVAAATTPVADAAATTPVADAAATTPVADAAVTTPVAGAAITTPVAGAAVTTPVAGAAVTTPVAGAAVTTPVAGAASSYDQAVAIFAGLSKQADEEVKTNVKAAKVADILRQMVKHAGELKDDKASHETLLQAAGAVQALMANKGDKPVGYDKLAEEMQKHSHSSPALKALGVLMISLAVAALVLGIVFFPVLVGAAAAVVGTAAAAAVTGVGIGVTTAGLAVGGGFSFFAGRQQGVAEDMGKLSQAKSAQEKPAAQEAVATASMSM